MPVVLVLARHVLYIYIQAGALLENRAFVPIYNCFLARFLNRNWPSWINTCISFVPEAIEPGQMLIFANKKIRSLAPAYGSQLLQIQNQSQNQLQSQINHSQNQLSQLQTIFSQINPFTYTYLTKKKEKKTRTTEPPATPPGWRRSNGTILRKVTLKSLPKC